MSAAWDPSNSNPISLEPHPAGVQLASNWQDSSLCHPKGNPLPHKPWTWTWAQKGRWFPKQSSTTPISKFSSQFSSLSLYLYSKEVVAPKSFMMQKTHNAALLSGPNLQHTSCETGQVCQQHSRTRAGFILGFRRVWQFQLCHELLQAEPCVVKCQDGYDVWLCKYD